MEIYVQTGTGHFPIRTFPHLTKYELDEDLSARRTIPHWRILTARTIPHSQSLYLFQIFTNSKTLLISLSLPLYFSPCVYVYFNMCLQINYWLLIFINITVIKNLMFIYRHDISCYAWQNNVLLVCIEKFEATLTDIDMSNILWYRKRLKKLDKEWQ